MDREQPRVIGLILCHRVLVSGPCSRSQNPPAPFFFFFVLKDPALFRTVLKNVMAGLSLSSALASFL